MDRSRLPKIVMIVKSGRELIPGVWKLYIKQ